jgi:hypothetical protein
MRALTLAVSALLASALVYGCGDDDDDAMGGSGGTTSPSKGGSSGSTSKGGTTSTGGSGTSGSDAGGAGGSAPMESLCEKYGGEDNVASVVEVNVIGAIAADCRISAHFTELDADSFTHVVDCLTTQVQELFGCDGITYAGSMSSVDRACRSMTEAHQGLGISKGDFDALIEDVVSGLTEAGVEEGDINAAAPALLGMEPAIVEDESTTETKAACEAGGAGGSGGASAGGAGGAGGA